MTKKIDRLFGEMDSMLRYMAPKKPETFTISSNEYDQISSLLDRRLVPTTCIRTEKGILYKDVLLRVL